MTDVPQPTPGAVCTRPSRGARPIPRMWCAGAVTRMQSRRDWRPVPKLRVCGLGATLAHPIPAHPLTVCPHPPRANLEAEGTTAAALELAL